MSASGALSTALFGIDDPLAAALHLLGALFFGWQALRLVRRAGEARRRGAALAVFAASAVGLLALSATYHALPADHAWKPFFQRADHAAIFLLIAGTLTSFHAIGFFGRGRWWMLGLVWAVALGALFVKVALWSRVGDGLGLVLYVGLSAVGLSSIAFLPRKLAWRAYLPMAVGALVYVGGALIDHFARGWLWPSVFGSHELFHVAVLAALLVHWRFFHDQALPGRAALPGAVPLPGLQRA
jgi:channel protein (hemolysin III family)